MEQLFCMVSVYDRPLLAYYLDLYEKNRLLVNFVSLGYGTATNSMLSYLKLDGSEKAVIFSPVTSGSWAKVKNVLQRQEQIDLPGKGIVFLIPFSSIGGNPQLRYLLGEQTFDPKEESVLQDTTYELIIVITNIGCSDMVMQAARKAGAHGGTVLHAKGTGVKGAEEFLGVTLATEKEMVYIVTKKKEKNAIMAAVMAEAGLTSKAKAIAFSLPVTDIAGTRFSEILEADREAVILAADMDEEGDPANADHRTDPD